MSYRVARCKVTSKSVPNSFVLNQLNSTCSKMTNKECSQILENQLLWLKVWIVKIDDKFEQLWDYKNKSLSRVNFSLTHTHSTEASPISWNCASKKFLLVSCKTALPQFHFIMKTYGSWSQCGEYPAPRYVRQWVLSHKQAFHWIPIGIFLFQGYVIRKSVTCTWIEAYSEYSLCLLPSLSIHRHTSIYQYTYQHISICILIQVPYHLALESFPCELY